MKHLIIGNGAAGITAAGRLKEISPSDSITVATSESFTAYAKIMLPDYIGGKIEREKLFIRDKSYYDNNNINLLLNSKAVKVDTKNKAVHFSNGKVENYDKLLIAVGGKSFIPPIEGIDKAGYYTINSLNDADMIKRQSKNGGTAAILGGGLTGVEMAFALGRQGMKVYLVEMGKTLLPQQLDGNSSDILANELSKVGVIVMTGITVCRLLINEIEQGRDHLADKQIELSDGSKIDIDMLVMATGTRSDIEFIKDTEIKCNKGILVDEYMKTSLDDIYAAGDVSQFTNLSNEYIPAYIWPNAMAQGKCAASNMAGQLTKFQMETYFQNIVQLRDIPFNSIGLVKPSDRECEILTYNDKEKGVYRKIVIRDNIIKGALFMGDIGFARKISALIKNATNISSIKHKLIDGSFSVPE